MASTMPLLLILLAVLIGSFYYIVQAEGGWDEFPRLMERVGIKTDEILNPKSEIRNKSEIPNNENTDEIPLPDGYVSGNSRFSQGVCTKDSECYAGGCSGEVCSSEPDVISTCEFSEDFPSAKKFECGCVDKMCGWRER